MLAPTTALKAAQNNVLDLVASTRLTSIELANKCDQLISEAFDKHFTKDLQDHFGLSAIALGSYARRQQLAGVSDVDMIIMCSKSDPILCTDMQLKDNYHQAVIAFGDALLPEFKKLGLVHNSSTVRTRIPGDLQSELVAYLAAAAAAEAEEGSATAAKTQFKQFIETLTMMLAARQIAGTEKIDTHAHIKELLQDVKYNDPAKKALIRSLSQCLGKERTLALTELDLKADLQYAALFADLTIEMLKLDGKPLGSDIQKIQQQLKDSQILLSKMRQIHRLGIKNQLQKGEIIEKQADYFTTNQQKGFREAAIKTLGANQGVEALTILYREAAKIDFLVKKVLVWAVADGAVDDLLNNNVRVDDSFWLPGILSEKLREEMFHNPDNFPELRELDGLVDQYSYQKFVHLEHALRAVEVIDRLARGKDADERFVALYSRLSENQKKILGLAALLHDCGKKEELEHGIKDPYYHADIGSKKCRLVAERLGFDTAEQRSIAQLVYHHLWLKDVSKPAIHTIHETLLAELPTEMRSHDFINLLTLLTYADGIATNPDSWTHFRSNHLWEAGRSAHQEIDGTNPIRDLNLFVDTLYSRHSIRLQCVPKSNMLEMLRELPLSFRALPPETICHFATLRNNLGTLPLAEIVEHNINADQRDSHYQFKADLLIISKDRKYLASNLVQNLFSSGLSIQSADFYTDNRGIAYNRITIHHQHERSDDMPSLRTRTIMILGAENLSIPNRKFAFKEVPIVTLLSPRSGGDENVLSIKIKAFDTPGLLLHILSAFNRVGLSLRSCSACPEGDYIEDYFELTYEDGRSNRTLQPVEKDALLQVIVQELLAKID